MCIIEHVVTENQLEGALSNSNDHSSQDKVFASIANEHWRPLMKSSDYSGAESLWTEVLKRTLAWEAVKGRVHKGTPFYFYAVTCLLSGKAERGFLLMHLALEEDILTSGLLTPSWPAWKFVTLDFKSRDQFFGIYVDVLAGQLNELMEEYRAQKCGSLTLDQFKSKFLEQVELRDPIFNFVYELDCVKEALHAPERYMFGSGFGSYRLINGVFSLCLIADAIIDLKLLVGFSFKKKASVLATRAGMCLKETDFAGFNEQFNNDFSATISALLAGGQSQYSNMNLSPLEKSLLITYGFRNYAAHRIEEQKLVVKSYRQIVQAVFNTIFCAVETLY